MNEKSKKDREKFYFFRSYYESIENLSDKNFNELCGAIVKYSFENDYIPKFKGATAMAWNLIKPFLDNSFKQYKNGSRNNGG